MMSTNHAAQDYARIEQAILYLERQAPRHPALPEIASHVGLSESHFQRLFTRWAGISPKRFLQFQTLAHARQLLAERRSVLDATYEAGLSSAGRLHDLFVTAEAVTPGEFKSGGAGLVIHHGVHDTPFGACVIAVCERGVCALTFLSGRDATEAIAELRARWPNAELQAAPHVTRAYVDRIFAPRRAREADAPLGVLLKGTNFQLKVWEALLRIPMGDAATYEDVAATIGAPKAVRAVGSAVARNPIAYLIPCHRVIRKTGAFGEYRWGPARKRAMLAWEAAQRWGEGERKAG
ncbi:MAG TPA: methylated-DNA--[protein]-cysteine S-methyltransferase [Gemmatimonadaceae bacterium]